MTIWMTIRSARWVLAMKHHQIIALTGIAAAVILAVVVASWIEVEIRFSRPCRLFAQAEWTLLESQPDTFEARLLDRSAGNRSAIDIYRFERGDQVSFRITAEVSSGTRIPAGQEIARFDSFECRRVISELAPQLAEAEANLEAARSGERVELIDLARSELDAAEAEHARAHAEHERTMHLHEAGLTSDEARDRIEAAYRQAAAAAKAAGHRLRAVQVGEKDAVVSAWEAHCQYMRTLIEQATRRLERNRVTCPIDGQVLTLQRDSVLVRVAALDTLYAIAPISPARAGLVAAGTRARVAAPTLGRDVLEGRVAQIDRQADTVAGQTLVWVTVAVPNPGQQPLTGLKGTVAFSSDKVSLLRWLQDRFKHTMDRSLG